MNKNVFSFYAQRQQMSMPIDTMHICFTSNFTLFSKPCILTKTNIWTPQFSVYKLNNRNYLMNVFSWPKLFYEIIINVYKRYGISYIDFIYIMFISVDTFWYYFIIIIK